MPETLGGVGFWPPTPSDGHFFYIVPTNVVLMRGLQSLKFNPTNQLKDANAAKSCVLVISCARGTKSVALDAKTATSSLWSSFLATPIVYSLSNSLYLLQCGCQRDSGIISVMELLAFVAAAAASSSAPQAARPPPRRGWVTLGRSRIWKHGSSSGGSVEWSGSRGSRGAGNLSSASAFNL